MNIISKGKFLSASMLLTMLMSITGCSTGVGGETVIGRKGSPFWFKTASQSTQIQYFSEICRGYGFKDDTSEMSQCLQNETNSAKDRAQKKISDYETREAIRRARSQTLTCRDLGNGISRCN